ncbi:MAG: shikimate dehydrogenase, partial [Verrucomicrobia bacterium]|nr:shikimate dehydrogenase [Verrucomicrobiota bacterium]
LFLSLFDLDISDKHLTQVDGIEFRLDLFSEINLKKLQKAVTSSPIPILFTLRKGSEGGNFFGSEQERETLIRKLLALKPAFFDLEYNMDPYFIKEQIEDHPDVKFIISYHNFSSTPLDFEKIYQKMLLFKANRYKIATLTSSTNETLSLLLFSKKHPNLSIIPMGEKGSFGRILSLTLENKLHYTYLSSKKHSAPGQISLEDLLNIYRYPKLNTNTKLYGLIGDPVTQSVGHLYHNDVFTKKNHNALYVKMPVSQEELQDFFPLAKKIGFQGLSVTMPLKESVLKFIDNLDPLTQQIQAANTLSLKEDFIYGTNTDGCGALDALEQHIPIQGKTLVILGAGGASKAIAFEAKKRGAILYIVNRTLKKAQDLAKRLEGKALSDIPQVYDILINTSPISPCIDKILPSAFVMDITYVPEKTPFLKKALMSGAKVIYGKEMFTRQADLQSKFWGF